MPMTSGCYQHALKNRRKRFAAFPADSSRGWETRGGETTPEMNQGAAAGGGGTGNPLRIALLLQSFCVT